MKLDMASRHPLFRHNRISALGGLIFSTMLSSVAVVQPTGAPGSFADVAERVQPAVIGVTSRAAAHGRRLADRPFEFDIPGQNAPLKKSPAPDEPDTGEDSNAFEAVALGSGFFISPDGYAVTNSHVVQDNDIAQIRTIDNKIYPARVVGRDSLSDLALIKVDGRADFSFVKMAERTPRVGDWVLTVGNPFGLGGTVTAGIVSAREREIETGPSEGFIQIDAPINSGDSGGPSLDTAGDIVGVNSMIFSSSGGWSGVAFAIPADTVRTVIPQLKEKGAVTRGTMGVEVQSVTPELADSLGVNDLHGAIVAKIQKDGPGAKAGLRIGDVITSIGGQPIKSAGELTKRIHAMAPGASVQLAMLRTGQQSSLSVTLGQLPRDARDSSSSSPADHAR